MKAIVVMIILLSAPCCLFAQRKVDPTWLHRYVPSIQEKPVDISASGCHYKPIFGAGEPPTRIMRSVARFGEATVDPNGHCKQLSYPREEQIYYILSGSGMLNYGSQNKAVRKGDFMYLPPGVEHGMSGAAGSTCRFLIMGFKIPSDVHITRPSKLQIANLADVKQQLVQGHPSSTQYRLLLGGRKATRDKLDCGITVTSLFWMDIAPGGTNFPHHHETAEEIYLVVDGNGDMAAGGGESGVVGLHPSGPGDAYFFRLNSTVGFYNRGKTDAHILAVRSLYPFPRHDQN